MAAPADTLVEWTESTTSSDRAHWIDDWRPEDTAFWDATGRRERAPSA